MGFIRTMMRVFSGKKAQAKREMEKTVAYLDGVLEKLENDVKNVSDRYKKANATCAAKIEQRDSYLRMAKEMEITAKESKERYKETAEEHDKQNARKAFDKMNQYKDTISILEIEINELGGFIDKLKIMNDNAKALLSKKKLEIQKAKSRIEFSKTMDGLTEGINDLSTFDIEGIEDINIDYHKSLADLDELADDIIIPTSRSKDFDDFFNN